MPDAGTRFFLSLAGALVAACAPSSDGEPVTVPYAGGAAVAGDEVAVYPAPAAPAAPAEPPEPPEPARSLSDAFAEDLAGHGRWVDDPRHGPVFLPHDPAFRPFREGRWDVQEDGELVWVSSAPFGWAVGHFGRWARLGQDRYGWIPGDRWSPGWVRWLEASQPGAEGVVGWAPLLADGSSPRGTWTFVPVSRLLAEDVHRYAVDEEAAGVALETGAPLAVAALLPDGRRWPTRAYLRRRGIPETGRAPPPVWPEEAHAVRTVLDADGLGVRRRGRTQVLGARRDPTRAEPSRSGTLLH